MVVLRAEAVSFDSLIDRMRDMRVRDLYGKFTASERQIMSATGPQISEIFENGIETFARFTPAGDRVLGFKLDKKLASLETIDQNVKIEIKTRGMKQKLSLSIQNMMISGLNFDELPRRALDKDLVKFTLKFKTLRNSTIAKKTLWYNPLTNVFIED